MDAAGEAWNYTSDQAAIWFDQNLTRPKVAIGALTNMAGNRIVSIIKDNVAPETLATAAGYIQKVQQFGEEHLAPGERTIVGITAMGGLGKLLGVTASGVKGLVIPGKGVGHGSKLSVPKGQVDKGVIAPTELAHQTKTFPFTKPENKPIGVSEKGVEIGGGSTAKPTSSKISVLDDNVNKAGSASHTTNLSLDNPLTADTIKYVIGDAPIISGSPREKAALEIMQALKEKGKVMAGAGHPKPIKDVNRLIKTYGGTESEWTKKTSDELNRRGLIKRLESVQIHWYENINTGQRVEFKIKEQ